MEIFRLDLCCSRMASTLDWFLDIAYTGGFYDYIGGCLDLRNERPFPPVAVVATGVDDEVNLASLADRILALDLSA